MLRNRCVQDSRPAAAPHSTCLSLPLTNLSLSVSQGNLVEMSRRHQSLKTFFCLAAGSLPVGLCAECKEDLQPAHLPPNPSADNTGRHQRTVADSVLAEAERLGARSCLPSVLLNLTSRPPGRDLKVIQAPEGGWQKQRPSGRSKGQVP